MDNFQKTTFTLGNSKISIKDVSTVGKGNTEFSHVTIHFDNFSLKGFSNFIMM